MIAATGIDALGAWGGGGADAGGGGGGGACCVIGVAAGGGGGGGAAFAGEGLDASAALGASAFEDAPPVAPTSIEHNLVPGVTVSPSFLSIFLRTPATGDGTGTDV